MPATEVKLYSVCKNYCLNCRTVHKLYTELMNVKELNCMFDCACMYFMYAPAITLYLVDLVVTSTDLCIVDLGQCAHAQQGGYIVYHKNARQMVLTDRL